MSTSLADKNGEMQRDTAAVDAKSWGDKPWLAFGVRSLVFVIPILLSLAVTWLVASMWEAPSSVPGALVRLAVLAVVALGVAHFADRGARKFLPLAALFRLSLVFPDQAPSRFAIALRSGNTKKLEERIRQAEAGELSGSQAEAAALIVELAAMLSNHDRLTRGHSERVRAYTALIAEEMKLSPEDSNKLQWAGLIHDVGKLRIDERILTKPGRLTTEEFEVIKTHPDQGMKIAAPLSDYLGEWMGAIGEHHERYDGGGYPKGLAGTDISLAGRIVSVADAYDVITAARSYKKPLAPEFARQELADNAGTQFDPEVVRAFLSISLGRLRRAMWPLSWAAQLPFLGTAVTTPVAQTVAAAVVTLATATGVAAATDTFDAFVPAPDAVAFVEEAGVEENGLPENSNVENSGPENGGEVNANAANNPAVSDSGVPTSIVPEAANPDDASTAATEPADDSDTNTTGVADAGDVSTVGDVSPTTTAASTGGDVTTTTSLTTVVTRPTLNSPTSTTTTTRPTTTTKRVTTTTRKPTTTTTATTTTAPTTADVDCARAQSGDLNLQGADLTRCDLVGVQLTNPNLTGAKLNFAKFGVSTIFDGGSFKNADLTSASIDGAVFNSIDFSGATFSNAVIKNSAFNSVNLTGANLQGAKITDTGISATMPNADLSRTTLTRVSLADSTLTNVKLTNATIKDSSFTTINAAGLIATNSTMSTTGFDSATLTGAKFDGTTLNLVSFPFASLKNATFASADIRRGNYFQATFGTTDFSNATMDDMNFNEATGAAKFDGATMANGYMVRANLAKSSFKGVDFRTWDFNAADLTEANFKDASFVDSSMQSVDATGASFTAATLGNGELWIVSADLRSATFVNSAGTPIDHENAVYSGTICPNGTARSTPSCW